MADKLLEEPKQAWIENLLNLWGAWAFSGLDFENRMNMLARLMMQADPSRVSEPIREMCDDELGLVISSVIGYCIKNPCPQDYKYLEAKYVYGLSVYAIAKYQWKKDKSISVNAWYKRVTNSIKSSEWVIAKFLDLAIKNHKNAVKLQKYAFNV
ncbi:antiterminator Q family protein [Glaesserella parasuis]|uniref:Antiterminator Q family protein n=1 Tax=Glaesserella parasuis TaxID=738 RepID=A0AAJ6ACK6_GLAPU|nr:antiterminator Q family protein [Glaesserella parasuis]MDG6301040.1 antiterminator Q family protein [Glaesserella parasuis]MDG6376155.1 antiterminator Q family protein [Glaesserella parasuis]MDG6761568.1 antiterminator Q family protein [Glaesserella parasuis]MDP0355213.1 antiterminator Q family protein [Glaesserella parasuis]MDP0369200.1 antiterminator Q family protein [Glaesserella parasuis]